MRDLSLFISYVTSNNVGGFLVLKPPDLPYVVVDGTIFPTFNSWTPVNYSNWLSDCSVRIFYSCYANVRLSLLIWESPPDDTFSVLMVGSWAWLIMFLLSFQLHSKTKQSTI